MLEADNWFYSNFYSNLLERNNIKCIKKIEVEKILIRDEDSKYNPLFESKIVHIYVDESEYLVEKMTKYMDIGDILQTVLYKIHFI